jgi:hypothetical protein
MQSEHYEQVKAALESADAAVWDKLYGKGLSVEYAQRVHAEIGDGLAVLEQMHQREERLTIQAVEARSAIRHCLQILRKQGGKTAECIASCEKVLSYEPRAALPEHAAQGAK